MAPDTPQVVSWHLLKHDLKVNWILIAVILAIMLLMSNVVNVAMSIMDTGTKPEDTREQREEVFAYLGAMAGFNSLNGTNLSCEGFLEGEDPGSYEAAFAALGARTGRDLSSARLSELLESLESAGSSPESVAKQFEYAYALAGQKGVFSGEELAAEDMLPVMLESAGISQEAIDRMGSMDMKYMLNTMYFTVIGLLPIFLLVVLLANFLIAGQADNGSMAYILSTPIKRSTVTRTHILFMVLVPFAVISAVCAVRLLSNNILYGDPSLHSTLALYAGMYILAEALAGICFLGSCLFNRSSQSLAFGGGIAVWCFLASLLGVFGSEKLVDAGMGVAQLGVFNKLTLVGLFDVQGLSAGSFGEIPGSSLWMLLVLAAIAVAGYVAGAVRFGEKDLPL